ncbi:hypothetical protein PHLGIDRAFT_84460 [Phlebiopsis gigantea 11061_1 CR5-6]|uniref:Uncharacterized protein n=1 Tax=Phlebiopsis gigantea (strain 11061_1 CR5-6) TaxID=745531 RepID=A0A0C3PTF6_PHLG1|nr:hypothetical protein PHLGIDRAFT_84460 [Phlebiopsis gigantea 11061_1 CR5-6]
MTYSAHRRPPSPLRNEVTAHLDADDNISEDGSEHGELQDGYHWDQRPTSPNPSVAQYAANLAQRVGSLVSNMSGPRSPYHPTDEELEAEAERERDRTRREAERILSREAESKRLEERVLAMLDSDIRRSTTPFTPPAAPALSSTPPSPAGSGKDGSGWFSAVKSKLTPTKESLTPAQQIIQETKAREKEVQKEEKKLEKERRDAERELRKASKRQGKQRSGDWPSSPEGKFNDPAFLKLHEPTPHGLPPPPRQMTGSPASSTPARQTSMPPSLAPSPMRNDASSSSPARNGPPLYAQFNGEGTLDIPATLLTIATRFEKLERWTVGHVRALEDRMDDVERWLVEKEKDKDKQSQSSGIIKHQTGEPATMEAAIHELRDELAEVQGRIGELGREMAKMITAPNNLNSGPSRSSASIGRAPSTNSSIAVRSISSQVSTAPRTISTPPKKEPSTSPVTTPPLPSSSLRTRLPYPTGDYATPPDSVVLNQGAFSPPGSPPTNSNVGRRVSVSGLPANGQEYFSAHNSPSGLPSRAQSPPSLPPPPIHSELRRASVSPTPRKRYTVALGGPIMSASDRGRDRETERPATPRSRSTSRDFSAVPLSTSPISFSTSIDTTDDSDTGGNDETIGKTAARRSGLTAPKFRGHESDRESQPSPSPAQRRARPVSMYQTPSSSMSNLAAPAPIRPLNTRLSRSRSTDKLSSMMDSDASVPPTPASGKFVDPLIVRRQTKEAAQSTARPTPKVMAGKPKVPIGQLVAFFNQEKT